jgi:hypothetical protein
VSLGWPPQRPVTAVTAVTPQITPHKSVTACNRCNRNHFRAGYESARLTWEVTAVTAVTAFPRGQG